MEIGFISSFNIFDAFLDSVFIFNGNSELVYINNTAVNLLETSERKILKSKNIEEFFSHGELIPELKSLNKILDSTPYREFRFTNLTGRFVQAIYSFQMTQYHDEPHWIMYLRDMTLEHTLHAKYHKETQEKENYILELEVAQRELEKYSQNLKKLVDERTSELKHLNSMMRALLDSLDPAFFMFDRTGLCLPIYSKSCLRIIECDPSAKKVWDVLKIKESQIESFKKWIHTLFEGMLPFKDLTALGPQIFPSSEDFHVLLKYFPLLNEQTEQLEAIVVMATDNTQIDIAQEVAEKERNYAMMMVNILKRRKEMIQFVFDAQKIIDDLRNTLNDQYSFNLQGVFRYLHTIKGGASSFSIHDLTKACHEAEQVLIEISKEGLAKETLAQLNEHYSNIRYQFQTFLKANEIFLGSSIIHGIRTIEIPVLTLSKFLKKLNKYPEIKDSLKKFEREIFYVPVKQFFEGYNDAVQSLAQKLGKKVKPLIIEGGDILVHRDIYSEMFSTFIHQFNNSVDHGIEEPNLRRFHHKDEAGEIRISVQINNLENKEFLEICISDDGRGIDPEQIRRKLSSRGIAVGKKTDEEVIQHVFDSQFTTKDAATFVSGRGIGMDAILHAAYSLGGTAFVKSSINKGTELWVRVPYAIETLKLGAA